jgi:hypothetical protein
MYTFAVVYMEIQFDLKNLHNLYHSDLKCPITFGNALW